MPSISELRNKLALAQSRKATIRLSNMQCIDILLKICKKNSIQLVPSNDGMLFYTIDEVRSEVENELLTRGGRVASYELSSTLNVQSDYIDMAIDDIMRGTDYYIKSSQGLLISKKYLSDLMYCINDRIQECGFVDFTQLSLEYDLPIDLIRTNVSNSIGNIIDGSINGNVIESTTFEKRKVNNIKAALLAVIVPILTHDISRITNISVNMVNDVITDLLKSGTIKGILKGSEYIPICYIDSVNDYILNNYNRNGYIEIISLKNYEFINEVTIKNLCKDSIKLDTVYINKNLFEPVSILINEAITYKSWRDLISMLPNILTSSDWLLIMNNIKNSNKNGFLIETIYISNLFIQDLIQYLLKYITIQLNEDDTSPSSSINNNDDDKIDIDKELFKLPINDELLFNTIKSILTRNVDNHFTEIYLLYPNEIYSCINEQLIKELTFYSSKNKNNIIKMDNKIDLLKNYIMKSELTIKSFEKIKGDLTNILIQNLIREIIIPIFNILLETYLRNNKINNDNVTNNNRCKLIEMINDNDIKLYFNNYLDGIKKKCILICSESYKELCKAMYINYNIKKDSRQFIKNEIINFNKQINSITNLDHYKCLYIAINLILLKNNYYIYINDKYWCINECFNLFKSLLENSTPFNDITQLITLLNEDDKEGRSSSCNLDRKEGRSSSCNLDRKEGLSSSCNLDRKEGGSSSCNLEDSKEGRSSSSCNLENNLIDVKLQELTGNIINHLKH